MAVSKRLRYEVLRRDNHACRYCGRTAPDVPLTVDHVVPTALGGSDEPANLVAACRECNAGKSATSADAPIIEDVKADALRWGAAMEYAAELRARQREELDNQILYFGELWRGNGRGSRDGLPRDDNWDDSIERFLTIGLDLGYLEEAMNIAKMNHAIPDEHVWRYFCGICWREVDARQQIASALIATDGAERNEGGAGTDGA